MYLKSISGDVLFEGYFRTVKRAVEAAVREDVCLDGINLRNANLAQVNLDNAQIQGACLWGANLTGANMSEINLKNADCRNAIFKDACLAEANLSQCDFRGSYFSQTLFAGADLSYTKFSCPSIFHSKIHEAQSREGAIYTHKGEYDCDLSHTPIVINGAPKPVVILKDDVFVGDVLHRTGS
jgi:uncharacterized protein YjbI with pentapeptide repeats